MSAKVVVVCCLLTCSWAMPLPAQATSQQAAQSMTPLTDEQLAVYKAVLTGWMGREMQQVNLATRTNLLDLSDDQGCGKKLKLEPPSTLVHRFQAPDLPRLGSDKITLIDPATGRSDVAKNDPARTMGRTKSVDEAVKNAFSHGLFTFSEIRFDIDHTHAIVSYGFVCGGLCGHGETIILEKSKIGWQRSGECSSWIS